MSEQIRDFLDKAHDVASPTELDADSTESEPKVPFQTQLKLTGEQEKKMMDHAFRRYNDLQRLSGRDQVISPTWWMNTAPAANLLLASQGMHAADTWMGKRARYDAIFYNDVSWRPWTMGPDNIFLSSNIAIPVTRRIARQMIARAQNSFFGSDPWFSVDPAPVAERNVDPMLPADEQNNTGMADKIQRFCRFKAMESDSKDDKKRIIARALILGECAVKTAYVVRDQIFDVEARVLVDVQGEPLRATDGNHITPNDAWEDKQDGMGTQVLSRDKQTPQPDSMIFMNKDLTRRQVLFEGAKSEPIYYKDFLCPMTATDVQTADCVIHIYDKPVMEFIDLIVKRGMIDDSTKDRLGAAKKMVAMVQTLAQSNSKPKAALTQELKPNENFMPIPADDYGSPVAEFLEFYLWFDANGDGVAENIMVIADRQSQAPVFYDYVANVTTDGLRPIEIVRINPMEGRWYGLGIVELFESYQTAIDLIFNRWNFSQSRSGRIDLWKPTNTQEGDRDPHLKLNWGSTYTLKPGCTPEDTLKPIYLNDVKFEQLKLQLDTLMQLLMNESGVSNANDAKAAGLNSSDLATGVINIQQSGDELFQPIIDDLKGPLTRLLKREIDVTLANMNPEEAFTYLEGDTLKLGHLTAEDVRDIKYHCTFELTAHKNQQILQLSAQAAALVKDFYMSIPPEIQPKVMEFYRRQLRILDPKADADTIIQPVALPAPGQPGQPPGAAPGGAPKGPGTGGNAVAQTQLGQKASQMPGVSAAGGTPSKG